MLDVEGKKAFPAIYKKIRDWFGENLNINK